MVGPRGMLPWFLRTALLFGLLTVFSIAAPSAIARPYTITGGPTESGDPTADDQPSPTPKPKAAAVQIPSAIQGTNHDATLGRGHIVTVRVPWGIYLRLLTRIWVL
ncbi:MAG TPA: hypothetical protein VJ776_03385 [Thermoanaerobaculia bacterium]|nr:hypothetical protein [Thermoanaerobaculia bacterium]